MKKYVSLFLAVVLAALSLSSLCFSAVAGANPVYKIDGNTVTAAPGEEVTVQFTLSNNTNGVAGMALDINFAGLPLEFVKSANGIIGFTRTPDATAKEEENVNCQFAVVENVTDNGVIASLTFTVKETAAAGDYKVKVIPTAGCQFYAQDYAEYDFDLACTDAVITVTSGAPEINTTDKLAVSGAQIRIPTTTAGGEELKQGLRFVGTITEDMYAKLAEEQLPKASTDTGVGFGMVVFPTALLDEGELLTKETSVDTYDAAIVPAVRLYKAHNNGEDYMYTACMIDIPTTSYTTEFTCVPYITYIDESSNEVTYYGEQYSTNVFSIADAAYKSKNETAETKAYLYENILKVVDPTYDKNNDGLWTDTYRP